MQTHKEQKRHNLYVDPSVQGAVLRQAVFYWLSGLAIYTFVVFAFRIVPFWLSGDEMNLGRIWYFLGPAVISSAALIPTMLYQSIRFSHRFVGPMIRFRQTIKQLAQGEAAEPIRLRQGDYWADFAEELNTLSAARGSAQMHNRQAEEELIEC